MRVIGLFEDEGWKRLLPFTRVRPVWALWWGMDTLAQKWARYYGWQVKGFLPAQTRLWKLYMPSFPEGETLWLNARLLPFSPEIRRWVEELSPETLYRTPEGVPVALRTARLPLARPEEPMTFGEGFREEIFPSSIPLYWLKEATDLFQHTGAVLAADWQHLSGHSSPPTSLAIRGKDNLFFHPAAKAGYAYISAEQGPVWIGPHAEIQDGAILQHTNTIGPHTTITAGARIRTHNSIGPWCKVGGEVGQSTFLGYSNKAHEGFFGHSVVGEWCNIGASSNTSNLKNTYGPVKLYDLAIGTLRSTSLQFCGTLMGDFARCGIHTPFTTGCVVDIFANVVTTHFTPKYIPAFSWDGHTYWDIEKALEALRRMKARRQLSVSPAEEELLRLLWRELVPTA